MILLALLLQAGAAPASASTPAPPPASAAAASPAPGAAATTTPPRAAGEFIPLIPTTSDAPAGPAPRAPSTIMVQRASDDAPFVWMGIVVAGEAEDVSKLETAAGPRGFATTRPGDGSGAPTLLILFDSETQRAAALAFYKDLVGGGYGQLDVQFALLPAAEARQDPLPTQDIDIQPAAYLKPVE